MVCLFIGDIPSTILPNDLLLGLQAKGKIKNFQVKFNTKKSCKMCFFHVHGYKTIKTLIVNPLVVNEIELYCQMSQSDSEDQIFDFQQRCIFVNNIPRKVNNEHLATIFANFGPVESAFIIKKKGVSKQFGFVYFENESSVEEAAELKKIKYNGKFMIAQRFFQKNKIDQKKNSQKERSSKKTNFPRNKQQRNHSPKKKSKKIHKPFSYRPQPQPSDRRHLEEVSYLQPQGRSYFDSYQQQLRYESQTHQWNNQSWMNRQHNEERRNHYYKPRSFEIKNPYEGILGISRLGLISSNQWKIGNLRFNKKFSEINHPLNRLQDAKEQGRRRFE